MTDWDKLQKSIIDDYFKDMGWKDKFQLIQKLLKDLEKDFTIMITVELPEGPSK